MSTIPWFKIDDGFYDHPKVDDLPLSAVGLWTLAGTYCAKQLTDGHVSSRRVRKLGGCNDDVTALVTAGLWEATADGWCFKDWEDYQPTREKVEQERSKSRKRVQKWRETKGDPAPTSGNETDGNAVTTPYVQDRNAVRTGAPTRPDPTPSTPKEKPVVRPEILTVCNHLADRIEGNGVKRPSAGKGWHDAARKLMDIDGYTVEQITRVIDWCQQDDFWKSNILSMPKLREKFGQLKLKSDAAPAPITPRFDPWSKEAYSA